MTDKTFLGAATFDVAIDAKPHIDLVNRHDPVHRLNRSVAFLARHACPYMRFVNEFHEIGQRVHSVPADLKGRLMVIGPGTRNRLNSAQQRTTVASDASFDWWNSRHRRSTRILVAVLAGNFVNSCMHTMAERDRLIDIATRCPWPLRKCHRGNSASEQKHRDRNQHAIHRHFFTSRLW